MQFQHVLQVSGHAHIIWVSVQVRYCNTVSYAIAKFRIAQRFLPTDHGLPTGKLRL
jgi:hypothetical protein